jgi:hypothetical protein
MFTGWIFESSHRSRDNTLNTHQTFGCNFEMKAFFHDPFGKNLAHIASFLPIPFICIKLNGNNLGILIEVILPT